MARVPLMPTSQSASLRQRAASASGSICASVRNCSKPSRIAAGVMLCSHRRRTGLAGPFAGCAYWAIRRKISSPSRPASQALMSSVTSLRRICLTTAFSRDLALSIGARSKCGGITGRWAKLHLPRLTSNSSGALISTRWPTAEVTTYRSFSKWSSCLSNLPALGVSARTMSWATEGFSAMISDLLMFSFSVLRRLLRGASLQSGSRARSHARAHGCAHARAHEFNVPKTGFHEDYLYPSDVEPKTTMTQAALEKIPATSAGGRRSASSAQQPAHPGAPFGRPRQGRVRASRRSPRATRDRVSRRGHHMARGVAPPPARPGATRPHLLLPHRRQARDRCQASVATRRAGSTTPATPNCEADEVDGRVFINALRDIAAGRGAVLRLRPGDRRALHAEAEEAVRVPLRHAALPRHHARSEAMIPARPRPSH